ncbi:multi-sensor signal transduction histidine kinase [Candidatus Vecturithrix granuli]|uniref:histidine kinase n=1 Tax=Vecturithrix granuli TaxID=1499967 RepID=A0A081BZQ9_VECG1|nr:multi-sensor signal transduction histidine kinase [Candidatus Vecturithrix granuli]
MMQKFFHRLAFKIGIVIILIEIITLSMLGWYYTHRFHEQIVQRVIDKVQIPGKLIAQGLLPYSAAANAELLNRLVGEDVVDSMVIWVNGFVVHALRQELVGVLLTQVSELNPEWFTPQARDPFIKFFPDERPPYVMSITPIPGVDGQTPVFFVYLKTNIQQVGQEKTNVLVLFFVGAFVTVWVTSLALLALFRQVILVRLTRTLHVLHAISNGQISARIPPPLISDEIGQLQSEINTMIAELESKINSLHQEIIEGHLMEEALRQSENLIHSLLESLPQYIYSKDLEGRFTYVNQSFCRLCNLTPSELIGKNDFDLHSPEIAEKYLRDDARVIQTGQPLELIEYHEIPGKEGFYVQVIKIPLFNSRGEISGTLGIFWDITKEKKAMESLRQSELLYRTTINALHEAIYVIDPQFRVTLCNSALLQWVQQYSGETQIIGQSIFDVFTSFPQEFHEGYRQIFQTREMLVIENKMTIKGREVFLEIWKIPVVEEDQVRQIITVIRDITEKKLTEKAISESHARYHNLIENAPLGIASFNTEGKILEANTMFIAIFGAPSVEAVHQLNMFTSSTLVEAGIAQDVQQCLDTGFPVIAENFLTSEWDKQGYVRYYLTPIKDLQGRVKEIHVLMEDYTERKSVENALKESETEYRSLFKNMLSGLAYHKVVVDDQNHPIDYIFLEVNDAYERLTGLGKDIIGKRMTEIIPGIRNYEPDLVQIYGNVALTGKETSFEFFFEPFGLWFSVAAYSSEKGYFVTIYDDITERKWTEESLHKLNEELEQRVEVRTNELQKTNKALQESLLTIERTQQQLVQSEKMAALGGLVAGIAHEINTPVGIGVTAASYLRQQTEDMKQMYEGQAMKRSDFEKYLELANDSTTMILLNLRRAADLIQSFKQVAVDQTSWDMRTFRLREYIDNVLRSLHPKLKRTRHIVQVNCSHEIELSSYPGDFSQIFTNLIINSLVHGFEEIEQGKIVIEVSIKEDLLVIEYRDNGKGIAQEHLPKIFDPFYTTKRGQGGSGLGLNIVYSLVTQRLNGRITCRSTPNIGTTFIIEVPLISPIALQQIH